MEYTGKNATSVRGFEGLALPSEGYNCFLVYNRYLEINKAVDRGF